MKMRRKCIINWQWRWRDDEPPTFGIVSFVLILQQQQKVTERRKKTDFEFELIKSGKNTLKN